MNHLEIAGKLTDKAISMLFSGEELLFVMTMANSGHMLFHDKARQCFGDKNPSALMADKFRSEGIVTPDGKTVTSVTDVFKVLRRDANSLKHGSLEPSVDLSSVCATLVTSCSDSKSLRTLSWSQLVFMWWFYGVNGKVNEEPWAEAEKVFPNLYGLPLENQLAVGRTVLERDPIQLCEALDIDRMWV
jgi:hypothetical protein